MLPAERQPRRDEQAFDPEGAEKGQDLVDGVGIGAELEAPVGHCEAVGPSSDAYTPTMNEMKPRVLLVEDDVQLRAMLEELFAGEGYEVSSASDGQKGLHLALTEEFDVLVLGRA